MGRKSYDDCHRIVDNLKVVYKQFTYLLNYYRPSIVFESVLVDNTLTVKNLYYKQFSLFY